MTPADSTELQTALALHQTGDLAGAERLYRKLLANDPAHMQARHSLGLVAFQRGDYAAAVDELSQALNAAPGHALLHNHLGAALVQLGKLDDAVTTLTRATELDPQLAEAHFNLGCALRATGQSSTALSVFQRAVELAPEFVAAWFNLGNELREQTRLPEAIAAFREVLKRQPAHPKAIRNLGIALARSAERSRDSGDLPAAREALEEAVRLEPHSPEMQVRLGLILQAMDLPAAAEAAYREALLLRPGYPEALGNLAGVLSAQHRATEALAACEAALAAKPEFPEVLVNRGNALWTLNRRDEALADYQRSIALSPDFADGHYNLAKALSELRRVPEAMRHYEEALRCQPDHAGAHFARGLDWLRAGDFARGWEGYEWRWRLKSFGRLSVAHQLWDGSDPRGKTIWVRCEQGLGDFIHFVRYAAELKARGAKVLVECPRPLLPLMQRCHGVDLLVPRGEAPGPFDLYVPIVSLPRLLGTRLENVPAPIPYLDPAPHLLERWRQRLPPGTAFRIGVAWQGNPEYPKNRERSFPLGELAPIGRLPGVELISLLPGQGAGEITVLGDGLDTESGPFMDTAAVIRCLDLVIACDSALAHLAGALGTPTWLALDTAPDWRWMDAREDSPWYPRHRLFRQSAPGDWASVFGPMHRLLSFQMNSQPQSQSPIPTITTEISPGELFDKITILELKNERIPDTTKLANVRFALEALVRTRDAAIPAAADVAELVAQLRQVNGRIWDVEDELRQCERRREFGERFVELARSVYLNNDQRAALKRRIDEQLGSRLLEEKSYTAYQNQPGS